jgi:hypothetical protein
MLSYPLCPFFVVFCNVVGTSNAKDFQLLQDVTDSISELVTENKFVNRLHRLCTTLLGLCKPLIHTDLTSPTVSANGVPGIPILPTNLNPGGLNFLDSNNDFGNFPISSWNDQMMTDLFNAQPSLDWFNADVLDPNWDSALHN